MLTLLTTVRGILKPNMYLHVAPAGVVPLALGCLPLREHKFLYFWRHIMKTTRPRVHLLPRESEVNARTSAVLRPLAFSHAQSMESLRVSGNTDIYEYSLIDQCVIINLNGL